MGEARERLVNWIYAITARVDERAEKVGWLDEAVREETEQLRELVEEQARERHRWGGHHPSGAFEDCPLEVCVKARAALKEESCLKE